MASSTEPDRASSGTGPDGTPRPGESDPSTTETRSLGDALFGPPSGDGSSAQGAPVVRESAWREGLGAPVPDGESAGAGVGTPPPAEDSILGPLTGDGAPSRVPRVLLWSGVTLGVLLVAYAGAQWAWAGRVPPETTVAGVEVGGLSADRAETALREGLGTRAEEPVPVRAGGVEGTLDPARGGLALDVEGTVDALTGFTLAPARLWHQVFGGSEAEPVLDLDEEALRAEVDRVGDELTTDPVDGSVVFTDGTPYAIEARQGAEVDRDAAVDVLIEDWLTGPHPVELPVEPVEPEVDAEATEAALEQARMLVSAPVSVTAEGQVAEIPQQVLAAVATFEAEDGELVLRLNGEQLVAEVLARTTGLLTDAQDARFVFADAGPVIEPGVPGTALDAQALADAVRQAGLGADRTAPATLIESEPAVTTAALEALGIREKVSEFATNLTPEPLRTQNLAIGASKVNGMLIPPGEVFSVTEAVGPVTTANGYNRAHVIVNGQLVDGVGGGLSQMATTTYNVGYLAGFEIITHKPHTYYFSRYPEGRESTMYEGSVDMQWRNDTPYGVLLQSWVGGGQLHVAAWSTTHWEVETTTSPRSAVKPPTTVYQTTPGCVPQSAGSPGFTVTVHRTVRLAGEVAKDESDSWTYRAQNRIVCGSAPEAPPAAPEDEG